MTATAAGPTVAVGQVYESGPHRIKVLEIGTGDRAGQVLVTYQTPGRFFLGERWWWPMDGLGGAWRMLPRGWDSTG